MYPKPYKRGKVYYFKTTVNGRRVQINTEKRSLREAQNFVKRYIDGEEQGHTSLSLSDYIQPFLSYETSPRVKRFKIENRSIGKYNVDRQINLLKKYILTDKIAQIKLINITPGNCIDFRERLFNRVKSNARETIDGKFPMTNTANKAFAAFKVILSEAKTRGDIPINPAQGIGPIHYDKTEVKILSKQEIGELFSDPSNFPSLLAYQVFRMTAWTGMRMSEVLALHWEQLDGRYLNIDRAWKNKHELGSPKSGKSRIIPLPMSCLDNLPEPEHKLIFCHSDGSKLGETWWRKNWGAVNKGTTPHSLRHALNSNLLISGAQIQFIQAYLGWSLSNLNNAQVFYTHINPADLVQLAERIDSLYSTEGVVFKKTKKSS